MTINEFLRALHIEYHFIEILTELSLNILGYKGGGSSSMISDKKGTWLKSLT